jgi:hypothetical protein
MSERPAGLVEIHRAELSEVSEPKIPDDLEEDVDGERVVEANERRLEQGELVVGGHGDTRSQRGNEVVVAASCPKIDSQGARGHASLEGVSRFSNDLKCEMHRVIDSQTSRRERANDAWESRKTTRERYKTVSKVTAMRGH